MIRIVVIHNALGDRHRLITLLQNQPDFEVAGVGKDGYDALHMVRTFMPDILILDTNLGDVNGADLVPNLKRISPKTSIIIITGDMDDEHLRRSIVKDVAGYLLKGADSRQAADIIRDVYAGKFYMNGDLVQRCAQLLVKLLHPQPKKIKPKIVSIPAELTHSELELIILIAHGLDTTEISRELLLSCGTIRNYTSSIKKKTKLANHAQLAAFAIRTGLVRLEDITLPDKLFVPAAELEEEQPADYKAHHRLS